MNRRMPDAPTPNLNPSANSDRLDESATPPWERQEADAAQRSLTAPERRKLGRLLDRLGNPPVSIVLEGHGEIAPAGTSSAIRLRIRDRVTLWKLVIDPVYEFGEAYTDGRIEVDGDLTELLVMVYQALTQPGAYRSLSARFVRCFRRPRATTAARSRENIRHHYDIGNDFYRLWLDERLLYTCAYFPKPNLTLESAQLAKMDHICRKLRLRSGQRVLEAGCGWGAFALHMAEHYGATVKAFNISREQIQYAREEARRRGLEQRVEFIEDDWRTMDQSCDVFVSVGMLEHVGLKNYEQLGDVVHRCLRPEGFGLIHSIGQNFAQRLNPWIERRIFPGACPPTLGQMMPVFEPRNFSVLDVENLRLHYALTLRHWLERFARRKTKSAGCSTSGLCGFGGCTFRDRLPRSKPAACNCFRSCLPADPTMKSLGRGSLCISITRRDAAARRPTATAAPRDSDANWHDSKQRGLFRRIGGRTLMIFLCVDQPRILPPHGKVKERGQGIL